MLKTKCGNTLTGHEQDGMPGAHTEVEWSKHSINGMYMLEWTVLILLSKCYPITEHL